jgi:hypothetical protein
MIHLRRDGTSYTDAVTVNVTYEKTDSTTTQTACGNGTTIGSTVTTIHDTYQDPAHWDGVGGDYALTIVPENHLNGTSYIPGATISKYIYYAGISGGGDLQARDFTELEQFSGALCNEPLDPSGKTYEVSSYIGALGIPDDLEADPTSSLFSLHKLKNVSAGPEHIKVQWDIELQSAPH